MIAALTEQQIRRYARHLVLGSVGMRGQRALVAARVELALDSAAAHVAVAYLAAAGIGEIAVRGADRSVEPGDVAGSPLLCADDVGQPLIDALAARVAALNPDVEVVAGGDAPPLEIERADNPARALIAGGLAAAAEIARICAP